MWCKGLAVAALGALGLVLLGHVASAAGPGGTSQGTVATRGQATVIRDRYTSQLRIKTQAAGDVAWLLEVALDPVGVEQGRGDVAQVIDLNGPFTLGTPGHPLASGMAKGWVSMRGRGEIQLSDRNSSTSLDMKFTVVADGSVTTEIQGQWPVLPTPQPSAASTAPQVASQPSSHFFWYLSRTAALVAYILLFINMCLGLGTRPRYIDLVSGRWRTFDLHQFTALLALALMGLHAFSLLGDHYFNFGLRALLVPLASPYRNTWTALGIVGFYAALVVTFSFYVRRFVGRKTWRALHYLSFPLFFAILWHSIRAGTDSSATWTQWMYILTGTAMMFLVLWRFLGSSVDSRSYKELGPPQGVLDRPGQARQRQLNTRGHGGNSGP